MLIYSIKGASGDIWRIIHYLCGMKRRKILLIYTGGTIGMRENPQTGALESLDFDKILPEIPELQAFDLDLEVVTFDPPVDSCDVDPEAWRNIAGIIESTYEQYDGFVVLHGTDTMAYTASALSFMLEGLQKPVILTGSQLPIGKLRTDGKENLLTAIEIASATREDGSPRVSEVCIFFHDSLKRGNRTTKSNADQFDAFESFNCKPLAVSAVDIDYDDSAMLRQSGPLKVHYNMDNAMMVLSLFPGIREDVMRSMLATPGLKGVVLRTFGSGNAPTYPWLSEVLEDAVARGLVIVNITQCAGGNVAMERYRTGLHLLGAGIVSGHDSTVEAALTKMMRLFGDGLSSTEVREMMSMSIAGEF